MARILKPKKLCSLSEPHAFMKQNNYHRNSSIWRSLPSQRVFENIHPHTRMDGIPIFPQKIADFGSIHERNLHHKTEDVNRTTRAKRQISHNVIDGIPWDTAFIDADKFQTAFKAQVPI